MVTYYSINLPLLQGAGRTSRSCRPQMRNSFKGENVLCVGGCVCLFSCVYSIVGAICFCVQMHVYCSPFHGLDMLRSACGARARAVCPSHTLPSLSSNMSSFCEFRKSSQQTDIMTRREPSGKFHSYPVGLCHTWHLDYIAGAPPMSFV